MKSIYVGAGAKGGGSEQTSPQRKLFKKTKKIIL